MDGYRIVICYLFLRAEFHSCCEDQEVAEGSNASINFYTDFHLKGGGNTFLEITHYPEHNAAKRKILSNEDNIV